MVGSFIVYGSWKIRHNEPISNGEGQLYYQMLPGRIDHSNFSILQDLRFRNQECYYFENNQLKMLKSISLVGIELANLSEGVIPLAVIKCDEKEECHATHFLTRLECYISHLIKVPGTPFLIDMCNPTQGLIEAFEQNHLYLNNFECFYINGTPDTNLEVSFKICNSNYFYITLNRIWYQELAKGHIKKFMPQLGNEIQHRCYDNNQSINGLPKETLATIINLPLKCMPDWCQISFNSTCESMATGNIFKVFFEDTHISGVSLPDGRLKQCRIKYVKTRGNPDKFSIREDYKSLSIQVENFLNQFGLIFV